MGDIETINRALSQLQSQLDASEFSPDRTRRDWSRVRPRVAELKAALDEQLLLPLDALRSELGEEDQRAFCGAVSQLASNVAAVLHASGDVATATEVMSQALELSATPEQRELLQEAERRMDLFTQLVHAQWLLAQDQRALAETAANDLLKQRPGPALARGDAADRRRAEAAQEGAHAVHDQWRRHLGLWAPRCTARRHVPDDTLPRAGLYPCTTARRVSRS